ncbi:unnamed protein product [Caenorhabditis auriculariae]|uniref:Uncharacterized protein n=1 Tax=Caenorhabditis auriculariae TaxID=2777116 RepID=A0A8S1HX97_9PELO|nr:unnamed protein product [Caenorhabditis auriculariae]
MGSKVNFFLFLMTLKLADVVSQDGDYEEVPKFFGDDDVTYKTWNKPSLGGQGNTGGGGWNGGRPTSGGGGWNSGGSNHGGGGWNSGGGGGSSGGGWNSGGNRGNDPYGQVIHHPRPGVHTPWGR